MNFWHLSDIHFGHRNLLKYQSNRITLLGLEPFSGDPLTDDPRAVEAWLDRITPQADEALLERLNEVIRPGDLALFYGDVAMGKRDQTIPFTSRLHGTKVLRAAGNHDKGLWPGDRKGRDAAIVAWSHAGWQFAHSDTDSYGFFVDEDVQVHYSYGHLPLAGTPDHEDQREVRYADKMLKGHRTIKHLHGHTHGQNGRIHDNGRQFDVGIDGNDLLPTSHDEILNWLVA